MSILVAGIAEVTAAFKLASVRMTTATQRGLDRAALLVQKDAKQAAPVLTGRLRASIAIRAGDTPLSREIYSDVEYAIYVEMGTLRMRAQPFIYPSLNKNFQACLNALASEINLEFGV
jgi:HK97 gp10 family phage protein